MNKKSNILKKVFMFSLLVYPLTLVIAIFCGMVLGIDSGWAMPAMSNHEKMYGWDAVVSYLILMIWGLAFIYIPILVFQVVYLICRLIKRCRKKL